MALAGDHVQVLVGGYELSADYNRIQISDRYDQHDVTAFSDAVHNVINGQRTIVLDHAGYLNNAVGRAHPVLKDAAFQGVVSVLLGQNTAPAAGDPFHSLYVLQGKYSALAEIEQFIPFGAMFANAGDQAGWGVILTPPVTIINTTSGSSVDEGTATTNGGAGFLHVLQAAATDTYIVVVEGSATGAFGGEQTTLLTFSLNGSALASERKSVTGSIPRYLRWKATRSGSAGNPVKLAVGFVRF